MSSDEEEANEGGQSPNRVRSPRAEFKYTSTANLTEDGHIRLFCLLPGSREDDIKITFFRDSVLENRVPYDALSYAWGDPNPRKDILVKNRTDKEWMDVTPNLEAALRQLRHPKKQRVLWVDALCINQEEGSEEKGSQIQQMDMIYSTAQEVVVWLGEASENSSMAMKFIKEVSDLSRLDQLTKDQAYLEQWKALGSLMRRPWFSRRWVVQELALAQTASVHCGPQTVGWPEFSEAVALFQAKFVEIQTLFDHDSYILGEIQGLGAHSLMTASHDSFAHSNHGTAKQRLATLEYLLCTLSALQVTNPWDTIFALTGLAKDVERRGDAEPFTILQRGGLLSIPIDYKQPIHELLAQIVYNIITQYGSSDVICRPWAPSAARIRTWYAANKSFHDSHVQPEPFYRLPSWIRDTVETEFAPRSDKYGVQYDRINAKPFVGQPGSSMYNSAAGSRVASELPQLRWIADGSLLHSQAPVLVLQGYYVDCVSSSGGLGGHAHRGVIPPDWPTLGSWSDHRNSPVPDHFWRALVGDRGIDGGRPPVWYRRACEHAWSESASPGLDTERMLRNCGSSMTADFLRHVRQTVWNRQMFLTHEGRLLGLGPSNSHSSQTVKKNDVIFILQGCSVPVILREHPDGDYYSLVGECYIHGIMSGELFEEHMKMGKVMSRVWLR